MVTGTSTTCPESIHGSRPGGIQSSSTVLLGPVQGETETVDASTVYRGRVVILIKQQRERDNKG